MNYQKHYDLLIQRAKSRNKPEGYTEKHHIVPRCMGGTNAYSNIAVLTAEEHFVAHQLLVKIYPNERGLIYGARRLACAGKVGSNKHYAWIRKRFAIQASLQHRGKKRTAEHSEKLRLINTGHVMPQHVREALQRANCGVPRSIETREKLRRANTLRMQCPAQREHISKMNKGRVLSVETRAKISAAHKGNRSGMLGKKHTAETIEKMRASAKARYAQAERNL